MYATKKAASPVTSSPPAVAAAHRRPRGRGAPRSGWRRGRGRGRGRGRWRSSASARGWTCRRWRTRWCRGKRRVPGSGIGGEDEVAIELARVDALRERAPVGERRRHLDPEALALAELARLELGATSCLLPREFRRSARRVRPCPTAELRPGAEAYEGDEEDGAEDARHDEPLGPAPPCTRGGPRRATR